MIRVVKDSLQSSFLSKIPPAPAFDPSQIALLESLIESGQLDGMPAAKFQEAHSAKFGSIKAYTLRSRLKLARDDFKRKNLNLNGSSKYSLRTSILF